MGASQSIQSYTQLPNDEVELISLKDSTEVIIYAEKVEANVCTTLSDQYHDWIRKRKERQEEKQKIIQNKLNKELMIRKMMNELVEIAKASLKDNRHAPISKVEVNEVLEKYDNIGHSKKMYNIIDICPGTTERQGWDGLCQEGWKVYIDEKTANELVMVVTKCVFTQRIKTYELMLKNGEGYLAYCNQAGRYAYVPDWAMQHEVFLVTSAGISTLDIYEGIPNSRDGRESELREYRRRMIAHRERVTGMRVPQRGTYRYRNWNAFDI